MKILIVDDEQLDLFINKKLLSLEYEVEGFTDVDDTVKWARDNSFDVLLCDFYLDKGLTAHNVLKAITTIKEKTFKAFVLSNHIDKKQAQDLVTAGFDGIIEKPLTLDQFRSQINRI